MSLVSKEVICHWHSFSSAPKTGHGKNGFSQMFLGLHISKADRWGKWKEDRERTREERERCCHVEAAMHSPKEELGSGVDSLQGITTKAGTETQSLSHPLTMVMCGYFPTCLVWRAFGSRDVTMALVPYPCRFMHYYGCFAFKLWVASIGMFTSS